MYKRIKAGKNVDDIEAKISVAIPYIVEPERKATHRETARLKYRERRVYGLCTKCGKKRDRDGAYCKACLAKQREYQRRNKQSKETADRERQQRADWKAKRAARGVCECGNPICTDRSKIYCEPCLSKRNARSQRMREKGLCRCGRMEPREGLRTCQLCADEAKRRYERNKASAANEAETQERTETEVSDDQIAAMLEQVRGNPGERTYGDIRSGLA